MGEAINEHCILFPPLFLLVFVATASAFGDYSVPTPVNPIVEVPGHPAYKDEVQNTVGIHARRTNGTPFYMTLSGDGVPTQSETISGGSTAEASIFAKLKRGVEYRLLLHCMGPPNTVKIKVSPPAGWVSYIGPSNNTVLSDQYTMTSTYETIYFKIDRYGSNEQAMEVGESTSLEPINVVWSVGLGTLANGRSAGKAAVTLLHNFGDGFRALRFAVQLRRSGS